jgi:hypothetical protein
MMILAGQGNPGPKYARNRHNIGFMVMDELAAQPGFGPWREKFNAMICEGWIETDAGRTKALLMKPMTFYNEMRSPCFMTRLILRPDVCGSSVEAGIPETMAFAQRWRIWALTSGVSGLGLAIPATSHG